MRAGLIEVRVMDESIVLVDNEMKEKGRKRKRKKKTWDFPFLLFKLHAQFK